MKLLITWQEPKLISELEKRFEERNDNAISTNVGKLRETTTFRLKNTWRIVFSFWKIRYNASKSVSCALVEA